jgi:hypothetical protein
VEEVIETRQLEIVNLLVLSDAEIVAVVVQAPAVMDNTKLLTVTNPNAGSLEDTIFKFPVNDPLQTQTPLAFLVAVNEKPVLLICKLPMLNVC